MEYLARTQGRIALHALASMLAAAAFTATAAERDICENKTGPELIRCIEAASRESREPQSPSQPPSRPASAPVTRPPAAVVPQTTATPQPARVPAAPQAAENCTGRSGEALRRCLAAGGRLAPEAAVVAPGTRVPAPAPLSAPVESCDGKSEEALRLCIEAQARKPAKSKAAQPQTLACGGYTRADQALCVHRNQAIVECRKRELYPDFDVCLRSFMLSAPEPQAADCGKLQARALSHCEARNRAYGACKSDKLSYFACLERQLGADAVLTRR